MIGGVVAVYRVIVDASGGFVGGIEPSRDEAEVEIELVGRKSVADELDRPIDFEGT